VFLPIDNYCERLGVGFWAEPLNALSNLAFILAAYAAYRLAQRLNPEGVVPTDQLFLTLMVAIIGMGSFLFHTLANGWSMLADVIPIAIYQITFLALYARRVMGLPVLYVAILMVAFLGSGYLVGLLPGHWLNGSLGYAPALVFLAGFAVYHALTQRPEPFILMTAAGLFILSLGFRSTDMWICPHFSLGVHYMWHGLNAIVLYLTTRAYLRCRARV
jgi:hypothetical protein